eukprot:scaffold1548_cov50-Phaeocystis_antarctica.AAC.5
MAGVASAGRPVRQRELSTEAGAVLVAMAGDVDAVASIDREQARRYGARVADALTPDEGRHQLLPRDRLLPGQYPVGPARNEVQRCTLDGPVAPVVGLGLGLHLDGLMRTIHPVQVLQAALVVPAAILKLGAE